MKSYKFRIYPNREQKQILEQTIETCRLLYNESLQQRRTDKRLSYYDQKKQLTQQRKTVKESLNHIHSQVLQNVLLRLERAFQNFHRDMSMGHPCFKRRGRYNSITYAQYGGFQIKENKLKLSFVKGLIKIKLNRIPIGSLKTCTIIRDIDRWFACISTNVKNSSSIKSNSIIGVDVGLTNWITLSNGQVIDRPDFLNKSIHKIKTLHQNLSRKKKGSKNRWKAKIQLAKTWRKVKLQREDYCHKVTANLAANYKTIVFEKLSIKNMTKSHNLATSILDATWYQVKQLAAYKAEVKEVNARNTTQTCSQCGLIVGKDLSIRLHECLNCGLKLDRDHNAALNILHLGQELTLAERKPILVSKVNRNKQVNIDEARSP